MFQDTINQGYDFRQGGRGTANCPTGLYKHSTVYTFFDLFYTAFTLHGTHPVVCEN
jgi:hypothetical protein